MGCRDPRQIAPGSASLARIGHRDVATARRFRAGSSRRGTLWMHATTCRRVRHGCLTTSTLDRGYETSISRSFNTTSGSLGWESINWPQLAIWPPPEPRFSASRCASMHMMA